LTLAGDCPTFGRKHSRFGARNGAGRCLAQGFAELYDVGRGFGGLGGRGSLADQGLQDERGAEQRTVKKFG
jgi:hypothetical protein